MIKTCKDCGNPERYRRHSRCLKCLNTYQWARVLANRPPKPAPLDADRDHFNSLIAKQPSGCWHWLGGKSDDGYGRFTSTHLKARLRAHRFSYFLKHGSLPSKHGCHTCDNPICVNPDHIFDGSAADNLRDMVKKGRHWLQQGNTSRVKGEGNGRSKLTEHSVLRIIAYPLASTTKTGRRFGVCATVIHSILTGRSWTHVTGFTRTNNAATLFRGSR